MSGIVFPNPPGVNPQLLAFAEHILAEVKAGRIATLACVTVSPLGQINAPVLGANACEVYVGADILKQQVLAAMQNNGRPALVA